MSVWLKHTVLAGLLVLVAFLWTHTEMDRSPFGYDEADYMYAAQRGFFANWSDTPAIGLLDFVRIGLARGGDPKQTVDLSTTLRDSGDMNGYRHWHGPVYYYGLRIVSAYSSDEFTVRRSIWLAATAFGVLVIYAGSLWLWPGIHGTLAAFLCSLLFLWSPATLKTAELAPHLFFSAVCLASLFCLAKFCAGSGPAAGSRALWYGALSWAGIAFCTMELALALIVAIVICGYRERARLRPDAGLLLRSAIALAAPVVLLWPASLYKLTFIKSYLAMAYLAVFRKGAWGDVTFGYTWSMRLRSMPVEWAVVALALIVFFARRKLPIQRESSVFLIFGLVMLASVLRVNAWGLRYVTPFFPALLVFGGSVLAFTLSSFRRAVQWGLLSVLAVFVFLDTHRQLNAHPLPPNTYYVMLLAKLRDPFWKNKTLLVPQIHVPTLHYYLPEIRVRGYTDSSSMSARLASERFDGVVYPGDAAQIEIRGR